VWKAQRFSWWMVTMLHTFPELLAYDEKLQDTDLAYAFSSDKALGLRRTMWGCFLPNLASARHVVTK